MSETCRFCFLRCVVVALLTPPVFAVTAGVFAADGDEFAVRQWTDTTGRFQIDAAFVDYRDGRVKLRRFDGKLLTVDISRLSKPDRDYVRNTLKKPAKSAEAGDAAAEDRDAETDAPERSDTKLPAATPGGVESPAGKTPGAAHGATKGEAGVAHYVGPPNPNCPVCRGSGLAPHEKFPAYAHIEGRPAPDPAVSVHGRYCPECQAGKDPAQLIEAEKERLATSAGVRHKEWEEKLQMELTRIETHPVVIHAQVPLAEAHRVAMAMETLTGHLQKLTGSLVLTPRRHEVDDMFLFVDKESYERLIAALEGEERFRRVNWDLMRTMSGGTVDHITMIRRSPSGVPLEDFAVHSSAYRQIQTATASKSPPWLSDGFAAYCEYAVLRRNLIHAIDAQSGNVRLDSNWDVALRQRARLGMLRSWNEMFETDLAVFEQIHYLQAKSMVTYLLQEPDKFLKFVDLISLGAGPGEALEEAYGKPPKELEAQWRRWLGVR